MYQIDTATAYTKQIITIEYWEWAVLLNLFFFTVLYSFRKKMMRIDQFPEYKFYVLGYYFRFLGSLSFALVSFYIYKGGDTFSYFENAMSMANLFYKNPSGYFHVLFSDNTPEVRETFDFFTGYPYDFIYYDDKTFLVVKLISPLVILTFKSYLLTSVLVGFLTYRGCWRLFQFFYSYYPQLGNSFAIACLFVPSVIFWGSGILKDPFTLMATGMFIYYFNEIFIKKRKKVNYIIYFIFHLLLIIGIKPYIFMILMPVSLYWLLQIKTSKMQLSKYAIILMPVILIFAMFASILILMSLGNTLDKFAVDKAFETASVTQKDLKQSYYEGKSFDIGNFDGSVGSAIRLTPMAIIAGLFRPFLFEADSPFMLLSALENLFFLYLFLRLFFRRSLKNILKTINKDPLLMFGLLFGIFFAYMLGLTTSNYGALIRFKIPMIPVFLSALFILDYKLKNKIMDPENHPSLQK